MRRALLVTLLAHAACAQTDGASLADNPRPPPEGCPTYDETPWVIELATSAHAAALDVLEDGRVLVVGATYAPDPQLTLWWQAPDGELDRVFTVVEATPSFLPTTYLRTPDRLYVGGTSTDGDHVTAFVVALDPDGNLDDAFADGGVLELTADRETDCVNPGGSLRTLEGLAPAGEDGLWLVGEWATPCQVTRPWLMRLSHAESRAAVSIYDEAVRFLRPLGRPTTFDSFPQVAAAHADGDGGLALAGRFWADGAWQGGLRRIGADGADDLDFGEGGVAALPTPGPPRVGWTRTIAEDVALDPAGGYVVVGRRRYGAQANPRDEGDAAAIWRLDAAGAPDPQFGAGGLLERPRDEAAMLAEDTFGSVTVAEDGQVVVGGAVAPGPSVAVSGLGPTGWSSPSGPWSFTPHPPLESPPAAHAGRLGCVWWVANTEDQAPRIGAFRR